MYLYLAREKERLPRPHALMYPCGKSVESRTHILGECEIHKEEQDVLEGEMRKIDECDMEKFDTLHSSDKTIELS